MFSSNDCRIERMMDPRKNWRSGFHTALMFMLVITAIMQSAAFATPLITTLQHVHVEQSSGKTAAAGETGVLNVERDFASNRIANNTAYQASTWLRATRIRDSQRRGSL
jgi:hypothetical protein